MNNNLVDIVFEEVVGTFVGMDLGKNENGKNFF